MLTESTSSNVNWTTAIWWSKKSQPRMSHPEIRTGRIKMTHNDHLFSEADRSATTRMREQDAPTKAMWAQATQGRLSMAVFPSLLSSIRKGVKAMAIGIKEVGKGLGCGTAKANLNPSKFFYISEESGEISRPYDTKEAAAEAVAALITTNDKTGETYYVVEVVMALQSARKVAVESYTTKKK